MSTYTVRPISDRTAFTGEHVNSPFTISWSTLMDEFDRELWFLGACDVVLEVDVDERGIRVDGQLRADAKARTPAVRLAFESEQGPLTYATDRFVKPSWRSTKGMQQDWQHNLCAIVRGLEALRKVDRYGITRRGEQYSGFRALPGGTPMPAGPAPMSSTAAAEHLRQYGPVGTPLEKAYRAALRATHPDHGGTREAFDRVQEAARVLGLAR